MRFSIFAFEETGEPNWFIRKISTGCAGADGLRLRALAKK
jgi:hypothetical protein